MKTTMETLFIIIVICGYWLGLERREKRKLLSPSVNCKMTPVDL
jgi:hypothetical protein